jgi:hypothetical protein
LTGGDEPLHKPLPQFNTYILEMRNSDRRYLLAIICVGCFLRVLSLLNNCAIEIDGTAYAKVAEAFIGGRFDQALNNVFSPGYPLFVGLLHLVIPDVELAGRLISVLFGTLLIWLSFVFGRRVFRDDKKAVLLSFLVAFHPLLVTYSGKVLSESVATFFFCLTIFLFYVSWQENRRLLLGLAGFCLVLTYLTRPEYLVYYGPLILLLLASKRLSDSLIFLLPLCVIGSLYALYLHDRTGLWMVSNKATLSPFVSLSTFFVNIPLVVFCFLMAISPLFVLLTGLGFAKIPNSYRNLLLMVVVFHIVSLAFISHSTKRYSVEFIPLCLIGAVEGFYVITQYAARSFNHRLVRLVMICIVVVTSLLLAYPPIHADRALQKQAGLFLLSYDPGSTIAARLPLAAFYSKGKNVNLLTEMSVRNGQKQLQTMLAEKQVRYMVVDEKTKSQLPVLRDYLSKTKMIWSTGDTSTFVSIYRIP